MRRILPLFFVFICLGAFAQPPNDDCSTALNVPIDSFYTNQSTTLATPYVGGGINPNPPNCIAGGLTSEVWYSFNTGVGVNAISDFEITVTGPAGSRPEFVVYKGLCIIPLQEQFCVSSCGTPSGNETISLLAQGLDPNTTYFVAVQNGSCSGLSDLTPFTINVDEYIPPVIMGTGIGPATKCSGTLYDSGGPTNNYGPSEDLFYQICPNQPHACVDLNFINYDLEPCPSFDRIEIYRGQVSPPFQPQDLFRTIFDQGSTNISVPDSCVTIRFRSDGTVQSAGFEMTWSCANSCAGPPPESSCDSSTVVPNLPYAMTGGTTCGAISTYDSGDGCGSTYLDGEDFIFEYTITEKTCINVLTSNTASDVGLFILDECPNSDAANCIAKSEEPGGDPQLTSVQLDDPGTYYIVVSSQPGCANCTGFDIVIEEAPCPLDVDPNVTDSMLVETIAAQGVQIRDIILNCPQGAYGTFTGGITTQNGSIDGGIILTNGDAEAAEGPNTDCCDNGRQLGIPGDPFLNVLALSTTHDACILEFDVFATDTFLLFNYIFGSEEYTLPPPQQSLSGFIDAFAFLISGPGIPTQRNLATLPNSNIPITTNTINSGANNSLFNLNDLGSPVVSYNGFTNVMTALADDIQKCEWYHIKLVIADAGDLRVDSGVFIAAESLVANAATVVENGTDVNGQATAAEGCADGAFNIKLLSVNPTDSTRIRIDVAGTATNGVDYQFIQDSLTFPPGTQDLVIPVTVFTDGIEEGPETVTIYLFNSCDDSQPFDSATIIIRDELTASMPDQLQLCGGPVELPLIATGADFVSWSPAEGLDDSTKVRPIAFPSVPTTYTVEVSNGVCDTTLSITVTPTTLSVTGSATFCHPGSTQVTLSTNADPATTSYQWTADGNAINHLSCIGCADPTVIPNPTIIPTSPGIYEYVLTFTTPECTTTDTITVNALALPSLTLNSSTICEGESVDLGDPNAASNLTYTWTDPNGSLNSTTSANPTATPNVTTTYSVIADNGFCQETFGVTVNVEGNFTITVEQDTTVNQGESVQLVTTATQSGTSPIGNLTYAWSPADGLSSTSSANPVATPLETTTYTVTVTSGANCEQIGNVTIEVIPPEWAFPNMFSPNGDGENDNFRLLSAGNIVIDQLKVFDRWGELVYSGNDTNGWDGRFNGSEMPQDTYVYFAIIRTPDGEQITLKGDVLLIR